MPRASRKVTLAAVGVLALSAGAIGYLRWDHSRGPIRPLEQARLALAAGDWQMLEQHLLADTLSYGLGDQLVKQRLEFFTGRVTDQEVQNARVSLAGQFRELLQEFVTDHTLDSLRVWAAAPSEPGLQIGPSDRLPLIGRLDLGNAEFDGYRQLWRRDDRANVAVRLHYPALDTTLSLTVDLAEFDDSWKIMRIPDLLELSDQVAQRQEDVMLRAAGEDWDELMTGIPVSLSFLSTRRSGGSYFSMTSARVHFEAGNATDRAIEEARFKIHLKGAPDAFVTATLERTLEPGEWGAVTYSDFLMDENPLHQAIEADREDMIVIRPFLAVLSEGDTIRTPLSWDRFVWEQRADGESDAHADTGG